MIYLFAFVGGLAGSLHCVGMCGVFPLALSRTAQRRPLQRQVLYHLGRVNTLVFIGAVSGAAGAVFVASGPARVLEQVLSAAAGLFMIVVGLETLGVLAQVTARGAALVQAGVGPLVRGVIGSPSWAAPLALGIFNAFLPCQLIYAFAAQAASTASVSDGMLTMLCFGLGTVPAMLALGLGLRAVPALRARLAPLAGLLVVAFGIVTLLRGFNVSLLAHHH